MRAQLFWTYDAVRYWLRKSSVSATRRWRGRSRCRTHPCSSGCWFQTVRILVESEKNEWKFLMIKTFKNFSGQNLPDDFLYCLISPTFERNLDLSPKSDKKILHMCSCVIQANKPLMQLVRIQTWQMFLLSLSTCKLQMRWGEGGLLK
jgi:hypothetical protein